MFTTHSYKYFHSVVGDKLPDAFSQVFYVILRIEPVISTAFLFLVGFSLFLVKRRNNPNFPKKILGKAVQLYLIGIALFLLEKGWQFPLSLLAPNILSAISFAMVMVLGISYIPRKYLLGVIASITAVALTTLYILTEKNILIPGLNSGAGAILPVSFCALWGYYMGVKYFDGELKDTGFALLGVLSVSFFVESSYIVAYSVDYKDYLGNPNLLTWLQSLEITPSTKAYSYWNHSTFGILRNLFFVIAALMHLEYKKEIKNVAIYKWIAIIGGSALWGYVMHLTVIGVLSIIGIAPPNSLFTWVFVLGLSALTYLYGRRKGIIY